jgi:transposase
MVTNQLNNQNLNENGCKWRGLPKEYGNWHSVYVRMSRWSKGGVLARMFEALQRENIIRIKIESVCIESTRVKVHSDGTGALKKTGFKALGAREEDLQQKFIWLPHVSEVI